MTGEMTPDVATSEGYIVDDKGRRWVTMSNALTRAAHGLTLAEKRLIAMAVSKLDSRTPAPDRGLVTRIQAVEFAETFGLDPTTAYEQLKAAGRSLYERNITFYTAAHRRAGKPIEPTEHRMRWVGRATYSKGGGFIELSWWHEVLPHLCGLRAQFTTYQLEQASALRSTYSWKLLELLSRFRDTGWAEYTVEDFATSMGATEAQRADFGKIRTKIIEPAIRELEDKDGWLIRWRPIKFGRKVASIRFDFARNPQGRLL